MRVSSGKLLVLSAVLFAAPCSHAAFDAYLKINGVEGEATDKAHAGWIKVESFTHGTAVTPDSPRASFSDLCLLKAVDKSSPVLIQKCAQGARFPSARLELVTASANRLRFYEVTLSNVLVISVSDSGAAGSTARPTQSICLNVAWIGWTYTEFDVNGSKLRDVSSWWDVARNRGGSGAFEVLRVTGAQLDPGKLGLSWSSAAGKTYNVYGSDLVTGPFSVVQTITSAAEGQQSVTLPIAGAQKFFYLEEAP